MENYDIYNELQDLIMMLDGDSFPELHNYLASIMDDGVLLEDDPYEIAVQILLCDAPAEYPQVVLDTIILLFNTAFENGNPDAMNDLGAQYYGGSRGFEQDFSKAVDYYQLAAKNGSRQAQENLGYCYYYGRDIPVDYEKAFHFFALGAFDGHLISLYKIGDMYANGYFVEKNEKEAFNIYERCMEMMTDEAAKEVAGPVFLRLGKCYLNGVGVEKDAETALICYQKAELFLYKMVKDGDYLYKKSLQAAIDGQVKARETLTESLPSKEWNHD